MIAIGMGDQKPPFKPSYEPVRDDVIGKMFASGMVRECPEPHVRKRYGVGGVANVSVYTCRKCRYVKKYPMHGGVGCGYGLELQERETGNG